MLIPIPHKRPWPLEPEFLTRLGNLEKQVDNDIKRQNDRDYAVFQSEESIKSPIEFKSHGGREKSKLNPKDEWAKGEYYDRKNDMCWENGFVPYYVEKYNVVPSREFFNYVARFYITCRKIIQEQ